MGMTLILLRVYDEVDTDYTDLFEPFHLFFNYLVMTILILIVVIIGFALFIIPGIIAIIGLSFAAYLVIDRDMGPVEAMKESLNITNGHRWNLLIFGLLIFFVNILGALAFGVGLLVTIPVSGLATVHVYRWLLNPQKEKGIELGAPSKMFASVTIALLFVFATLLVLAFGGTSERGSAEGRDIQRVTHLKEIKAAASVYFDDKGFYPENQRDLTPGYISSLPKDPSTKEHYAYTMLAGGVDYEICTTFEAIEDIDGFYCEFGLDLGAGE